MLFTYSAPGPRERAGNVRAQMAIGLSLSLLGGACALLISRWASSPYVGAPVVALLIGIAGAFLSRGSPNRFAAGYALAARHGLRIGIVLLGAQISIGQIYQLGLPTILIVLAAVSITISAAVGLGGALGLGRSISLLIGFGTGICGASAILATAQVIRAKDRDVAVSLLVISILGGIGVALTPVALQFGGMMPNEIGIWAGLSLHEVAHAVGAAFIGGEEAGEIGTIAKLARVLALAPALMMLSFLRRDRARMGAAAPPLVPWFVVGFLIIALLNSVVALPLWVRPLASTMSVLLLLSSLVAIGLQTRIGQLTALRGKVLFLGISTWIVILAVTCCSVLLLRP